MVPKSAKGKRPAKSESDSDLGSSKRKNKSRTQSKISEERLLESVSDSDSESENTKQSRKKKKVSRKRKKSKSPKLTDSESKSEQTQQLQKKKKRSSKKPRRESNSPPKRQEDGPTLSDDDFEGFWTPVTDELREKFPKRRSYIDKYGNEISIAYGCVPVFRTLEEQGEPSPDKALLYLPNGFDRHDLHDDRPVEGVMALETGYMLDFIRFSDTETDSDLSPGVATDANSSDGSGYEGSERAKYRRFRPKPLVFGENIERVREPVGRQQRDGRITMHEDYLYNGAVADDIEVYINHKKLTLPKGWQNGNLPAEYEGLGRTAYSQNLR